MPTVLEYEKVAASCISKNGLTRINKKNFFGKKTTQEKKSDGRHVDGDSSVVEFFH